MKDEKLTRILDKIDQNKQISWEEYKFCFVENGELNEEIEYEIYKTEIQNELRTDDHPKKAA